MIKRLIKLDNCFAVDSFGKSGSLTFMWNNVNDAQVQSFTKWHVNLLVKDTQTINEWLLTGFYGHPDSSKRSSTLNLLKALDPTSQLPWFCFKDFNEIATQHEK